jgi:alpha-tubulin suppressor-like RCC1 family protein
VRSFLPFLGLLLSACAAENAAPPSRDQARVILGPPGPPASDRIALGLRSGCAILPDRGIACFGINMAGESGPAEQTYVSPPQRIAGLHDVVQLTANDLAKCALVRGGDVYCWGDNSEGVLGYDTEPKVVGGGPKRLPHPRPTRVDGIDHAVEVRTGGGPTCARKDDGTVWCWGRNDYGHITVPAQPSVFAPTRMQNIVDAQELAVSSSGACVRHSLGEISCWGSIPFNGTYEGLPSVPLRVPGVAHATSVALAMSTGLASSEDGTVMAWGSNLDGLLFTDGWEAPATPIPLLSDVAEVRAQYMHACARMHNGTLFCWGRNELGELGLGTVTPFDSNAPPASGVPDVSGVEHLTVGSHGACAERNGSTIVCFGDAAFGGLGTSDVESVPQGPSLLPLPE